MDKVIRGGEVAVLYSVGYGTGWYTYDRCHPGLLYDWRVVAWVEDGKPDSRRSLLKADLEDTYPGIYLGGIDDLEIRWVPVGTRFYIHEYDGSERVVLVDTELDIQVA